VNTVLNVFKMLLGAAGTLLLFLWEQSVR